MKGKFSPAFNLEEQYKKYKNVLKNAEMGKVVTRFPPEPSGYLHIGHIKAALLNYHYAKIYGGRVQMRLEDSNPTLEKEEYVQSIMDDLKLVYFEFEGKLTYTSDYFDFFEKLCEDMIKQEKFYCDNTPVEQMREERQKGIESKCRNNTIEQNLEAWEGMKKGIDGYCVRAKISMTTNNKCMRDPVMYRVNHQPHHRTGTKYKVYPTYDFSCPIIDSMEGVTHAMRTNEYADRNEQYHWMLKATGYRDVNIYDYSRLNMVNTFFSKRKLRWFVDNGYVTGWDDPRFPTLRGILRRGILPETLIQFMLEQGPSKNAVSMEWDKLWAINKQLIDPICPRYTAIATEKICKIKVENLSNEIIQENIPAHQKNKELGTIVQFKSNELYIEYEDATKLVEGEKVTLMKWGNFLIKKIEKQENESLVLIADYLAEDKDFKNTKKINWLSVQSPLTKVFLVEYDHLCKVKKPEEDMKLEDIVNTNSKFETEAFADPNIKNLEPGTHLQFERRGYFIIDRKQSPNDQKIEIIYIPDGSTKTASTLTTKVDVSKMAGKGTKEEKEKEQKENEEKKSKKQLKKDEKKNKKKENKEKKQGKKEEESNQEEKKVEEKKVQEEEKVEQKQN